MRLWRPKQNEKCAAVAWTTIHEQNIIVVVHYEEAVVRQRRYVAVVVSVVVVAGCVSVWCNDCLCCRLLRWLGFSLCGYIRIAILTAAWWVTSSFEKFLLERLSLCKVPLFLLRLVCGAYVVRFVNDQLIGKIGEIRVVLKEFISYWRIVLGLWSSLR